MRNKWVWDKNNVSVFGVKANAMNLLQDWRKAREECLKNIAAQSVTARTWSSPPPGWVKVNIDAATFFYLNCSGVGSVIRDDHGSLLRAQN